MRVSFSSSVYCKKYLQQIYFKNKIEPFSVQSVQALVLGFKTVTADTRRVKTINIKELPTTNDTNSSTANITKM